MTGIKHEMNVERLHAITIAVKAEITALDVIGLLDQLSTALQNMVSQPQQPTYQEQVSSFKKALQKKLTTANSNDFSPAWKQSIDELGIQKYLGSQLADKIEAIFQENQITPSVALSEIQQLLQKVSALSITLDQLVLGFGNFNLGHEVLNPGEGEVGIMLPRAYLDNRFDKLAKEFKEINSILSTISEVATGKTEHFEIRSLSTSDPFVLLGASIGVLASIALTIKPIISAYKEILEVRLLHAQLAEKKVASERLKGVEDHTAEIMSKAIEEIKTELLARSPLQDNGRKNELSNALGAALNKLANRIDRGFNIEIRVEPIKTEEGEEEEEGLSDTEKEDRKNVQIIFEAMKTLEFMHPDGTPILHLPENIPDNSDSL